MTAKIIRHLTHKTGWFQFSRDYDPLIVGPLLAEAETLHRVLLDLPILPDLLAQLDKDLIRRSIMGTAAIEGNPLSEEEVGEIIESPEKAKSKAEKEIANLSRAYAIFKEKPRPDEPFLLSEEFIRETHQIISEGTLADGLPGVYRNVTVKVGDPAHGGVYTPPKTLDDVKTLMGLFIDWINSPELLAEHPLLRANLAHYHLAKIHPFSDGNGRVARYIEAALLRQTGYRYLFKVVTNYYYKEIDNYYIAFSESEKNNDDITSFIKFSLQLFILSLSEVKGRVVVGLKFALIKEYIMWSRDNRNITERQCSLLLALLNYGPLKKFDLISLFSDSLFASLYKKVSESTARRDLKHLVVGKFLIFNEGLYRLNLRMMSVAD